RLVRGGRTRHRGLARSRAPEDRHGLSAISPRPPGGYTTLGRRESMILRNVGLLLALFAAPLLATPAVAHGQGSDQLAMPSPSQIGLSSAGTATSPLQRPVTLDVTNMELGRILAEISSQAALGLVYETGLVPANRRLTVRLDSTAAGAAL